MQGWIVLAQAGCGWGDAACVGDQMLYEGLKVVARCIWMLDRILLQLCYLFDELRWWLINIAFLQVYSILTNFAGEALVAAASLALTLALIFILASPLTGTRSPFNIRHIFLWIIAGPLVLSSAGPWLADLEQLRGDLSGMMIRSTASVSFGGAVFAPGGGDPDMAQPPQLYPSQVCGATTLPRRSGGDYAAGDRRVDELVAGLLFVTTADIHCPNRAGGPDTSLPSGFYSNPASPYLSDHSISDEHEQARQAAIDRLTQGIVRLLLALVPAFLAVLYYAIQLIFTLALIALWAGLPFGVIVGFFRRNDSWFTGLIRRAVVVLQVTWVASLVIGLLFAGLQIPSTALDATLFVAFALAALCFLIYIALLAVNLLIDSIGAVSSIVGESSGFTLAPQQAVGQLGQVVEQSKKQVLVLQQIKERLSRSEAPNRAADARPRPPLARSIHGNSSQRPRSSAKPPASIVIRHPQTERKEP